MEFFVSSEHSLVYARVGLAHAAVLICIQDADLARRLKALDCGKIQWPNLSGQIALV